MLLYTTCKISHDDDDKEWAVLSFVFNKPKDTISGWYDHLYRVEKLIVRAAPLVDPDEFENYFKVVKKYKDKADNTAMMAYPSSWGEANPNGGKEVIGTY